MSGYFQQCGSCRHGKAFPEPGDPPKEPVKPKGFWSFLWDGQPEWMDYRFAEARYLDSIEAHKNLVRCKRFPQVVTKRKTDSCGEFKDKIGAHL